eukprot:g8785.t1
MMLNGRAQLTTKGTTSLTKRRSNANPSLKKTFKPEASFRSSLFRNINCLKSKRISLKPSRQSKLLVHARVEDPDLATTEEEDPDKYPPNIFWRAMAAFMYLVPWIDAVTLGREVYHKFPVTIYLYFASSPFFGIYFLNNFAPLVIFFLMFLAVVKNKKLSHFVRFNCMQAIMLDIAVMLFTILHTYFPAEVRWSWLLTSFDMLSWICCMSTVLYSVFFTLKGSYADIPYVSEAVYIQVELSDYA